METAEPIPPAALAAAGDALKEQWPTFFALSIGGGAERVAEVALTAALASGALLPVDGNGWLTTGEVARRFGVSPKTVIRWADEGHMPCIETPGGRRRFRADDIRAYLDEQGRAVRERARAHREKRAQIDADAR